MDYAYGTTYAAPWHKDCIVARVVPKRQLSLIADGQDRAKRVRKGTKGRQYGGTNGRRRLAHSMHRTLLEAESMGRSQRRGHAVKQERRAEAGKRVAGWQALTTGEKVASLDGRLGVGVGAAKQRKALANAN